MDQIQNFINQARTQGKTDEQIKELFLQQGWTSQQLQSYFEANNLSSPNPQPMTPAKKDVKLWIFILIIMFVLTSIGTSVWFLSTNFKKTAPNNSNLPSTISPTPIAELPPSPLALFLQFDEQTTRVGDNNTNLAEVKVFDLAQKKLLLVDPLLAKNENFLPTFGPWSHDGKYLPILMVTQSGQPHPLIFYDAFTQKAKTIYTFTGEEQQYGSMSTQFWFASRWLDNSRFAFNRSFSPPNTPITFDTITDSGTIGQTVQTNTIKMATTRLTFETEIASATSSGVVFIYKNMQIDNQPVSIAPTGTILGLIGEQLVSWERPKILSFQELAQDPVFSKKLQSASEAEAALIIEQALHPQGDSLVHFYDIRTGKEANLQVIKNDGWIVTDIQIRPLKQTLIFAQKEKAIAP